MKDDGIGRGAAKNSGIYSTGKGLDILAQQIELYNSFNDEKIIQEVNDLYEDDGKSAGTEYKIYLPFQYSYAVKESL